MPAYTLNDFIYSYTTENGRAFYKVQKVNEENSPPKTLSKYYALTPNSIKALKGNHFYLPQPDDFNDIFDASPNLWDFTSIKLEQLKNYLLKWWDVTTEYVEQQFQENKEFLIEEFRFYLHQHLSSKLGLVCMTDNKLSEIMWGYYGNNEGFLVELNYNDFSKNYFQGPFPINYLKKKKRLDPNIIDDWPIAFLIQILTKKDVWKEENEYRFLVETPKHYELKGFYNNDHTPSEKLKREALYPVESILGIYLGFNFFKDEIYKKQNDGSYSMQLISTKNELRNEFLKMCIEKKYRMYQMGTQETELSMTYKEIKVSLNTDYNFQLEYLH